MKHLTKITLLIASVLLSSLAMASTKLIDERCWQTTSPKTHKTVNLLFRLYAKNDEWAFANVRYDENREAIPLTYKDTKEIQGVEGRPSHFRHYFNEMYQGKLTGKYTFDSQGANVWGFKYFPKNSNKPLVFKEKFIGENISECFID